MSNYAIFYFIKKVKMNMDQLTFNFDIASKDTSITSYVSLSPSDSFSVENTNLLIPQFQKKIKSMLPNNNDFDCSIEYLNYRLLLKFYFSVNGRKKSHLYFASLNILNGEDYELYALLKYVLKERHGDYGELKRIIRKFAFYPKCRSHLTNTYLPGRVYDINKIFIKLNNLFFDGKLSNPLFWRKPKVSKRYKDKNLKIVGNRIKSLSLGAYCYKCNTIFINSILDNHQIPVWIVEAIAFHEMVHSYVFNFISHFASPHGAEFKSLYYKFPQAKESKKMLSSTLFFKKLREIYLENILQC